MNWGVKMRITITVSIDVDLKKVYKLCKPLSKATCKNEIILMVKSRLNLRATDENGGWVYPCEENLAGNLIELGLATEIE
jgi:phage pi2 protein 07